MTTEAEQCLLLDYYRKVDADLLKRLYQDLVLHESLGSTDKILLKAHSVLLFILDLFCVGGHGVEDGAQVLAILSFRFRLRVNVVLEERGEDLSPRLCKIEVV